jgi:hypothetical protein
VVAWQLRYWTTSRMVIISDWISSERMAEFLRSTFFISGPARALERQRFWELDISIDDATLRDGAADIARMISSSAQRGAASGCRVLFYLLRTRLTNIRSNRLWPEVTGGSLDVWHLVQECYLARISRSSGRFAQQVCCALARRGWRGPRSVEHRICVPRKSNGFGIGIEFVRGRFGRETVEVRRSPR